MNDKHITVTARVTYVMTGYGDLTISEDALCWNKSATSFLAFGAANAMTENHFYLPLADISKIGTYTYFPGGGLSITDNHGKVYKFSFKKRKEFNAFYSYLQKYMEII